MTVSGDEGSSNKIGLAALSALGVVYGDIGTSPLYAFRQAMLGVGVSEVTVLGILSMIFWALVIVVSLKYLVIVMRADNNGEGGILALLALLNPWRGRETRGKGMLIAVGLFGAALLYGDGIITPAISVLSAVEGIKTVTDGIDPFVIPVTIAILIGLFSVQSQGTAKVGALFGPVTLTWFIVIAILGIVQIAQHPIVLLSLNPFYALRFAVEYSGSALVVLGAVFLVVTGGEALYADMGHFGRVPIRMAWFGVAFPCLMLNYLGQGALVLGNPAQATQSFFHLAPTWARIPLVLLATAATVIASQAVISGAFSLTRQATLLGQFPRVLIRQTSAEETGQIYVPAINYALAVATIGLVLGFRRSENLAAAYGIAVSTTMVITTFLTFFVMRKRWRWGRWPALALSGGLIALDVTFLGANTLKIFDGGWLPLMVGGGVFFLMSTWARGRKQLLTRLTKDGARMDDFLQELRGHPVVRVPGTAVFLTGSLPRIPPILRHQLRHNQILHEKVVLLTVLTEDAPRVSAQDRLTIESLGQGFHRIYLRYGFMQVPNVPVALRLAGEMGLEIDLERTTYFIGRETIIASNEVPGMALWREKFFAFMSRNTLGATTFYKLPTDRVFEVGMQVEI